MAREDTSPNIPDGDQTESKVDSLLSYLSQRDPKYPKIDFRAKAESEARHALLERLTKTNPWYAEDNLPDAWVEYAVRSSLRGYVPLGTLTYSYPEEIYENALARLEESTGAMAQAIQESKQPCEFDVEKWYDATAPQKAQVVLFTGKFRPRLKPALLEDYAQKYRDKLTLNYGGPTELENAVAALRPRLLQKVQEDYPWCQPEDLSDHLLRYAVLAGARQLVAASPTPENLMDHSAEAAKMLILDSCEAHIEKPLAKAIAASLKMDPYVPLDPAQWYRDNAPSAVAGRASDRPR